jgi:glycerophosphoryl diester phosphodiesterase
VRYGFAHRGGRPGPDNTLAAFTAALDLGANGLETDAWLSLDGAVVLDHDGIVRPGSGQAIADVRRDQLPAHMPTLDELYETCGIDYELAIDVKGATDSAAIVEVARRHGALDRLWLVVGDETALREVDLAGAHGARTLRGNVLRSRSRRAALASAKAAGLDAVNARWMWWTRALVDEVHGSGLLAFGYDAQRPAALKRTVAIGLDGVFSDHVETMLAVLRNTTVEPYEKGH